MQRRTRLSRRWNKRKNCYVTRNCITNKKLNETVNHLSFLWNHVIVRIIAWILLWLFCCLRNLTEFLDNWLFANILSMTSKGTKQIFSNEIIIVIFFVIEIQMRVYSLTGNINMHKQKIEWDMQKVIQP